MASPAYPHTQGASSCSHGWSWSIALLPPGAGAGAVVQCRYSYRPTSRISGDPGGLPGFRQLWTLRLRVPQIPQVPQVPQSQPWPVPTVFPALQVPVTSRVTSSVRIVQPAPVPQPWPLEDPRFRRLLGALRPKECDLTALANTMWGRAASKVQDLNVGDNLSRIAMGNVKNNHPWLYYVYSLITLLVVWAVRTETFRSMKEFCKARANWLKQLQNPQANTVMVEGIPEEQQQDAKVKAYFDRMFGEGSVAECNVAKTIPDLETAFAELQAAKAALDMA
eukprot:s724_g1.t1